MPLDKQSKKMLEDNIKLELPALFEESLQDARKRVHKDNTNKEIWEKVFYIQDEFIPCSWGDMRVRVYRPNDSDNLPLFLYFHGGGWVVCDLDTHESVCRMIANRANCCVMSVDYRMGPEHKFPAAADDAYYSLDYIYNNASKFGIDKDKIAIGGDSAGGQITAVLAQMMRDRNGTKAVAQILIYPVTDYYKPGTKSYEEYAKGYALDKAHMIWFWDQYLIEGEDVDNPYISPNRAKHFKDLPKTLLITAEYDPLRDEAEEYARKLSEAGNDIIFKRVDGVMHGYLLHHDLLDKAKESIDDISGYLKSVFK
jgi:acetyl esterase